MEYTFRKLDINEVKASGAYDSRVKTPLLRTQWLDFINAWHGYQPVIIEIAGEGGVVAYFTALEKKIAFIKMLGSPLPGCLGQTMGFTALQDCSVEERIDLLDATVKYLQKTLQYHYITVTDVNLGEEVFAQSKMRPRKGGTYTTWVLDLSKSEEELLAGLNKKYRRYVRDYSEKFSGTVEEDDSDEMVLLHNEQLKQVYGRDGIDAPNVIHKFRSFLAAFRGTDMALGLRADIPEQTGIATAYRVAYGDWGYNLSIGSEKAYMDYHSNQGVMWRTICYMKQRGCKYLDFVGPGEHKGKYGAQPAVYPVIIFSTIPGLLWAMDTAKKLYYASFRWRGAIKKLLRKASKET